MPEPKEGEPQAPKVEDLVKQVENLNKAVAGYRDEARSATEKAKTVETTFEAYKKEVEPKLKVIAGEPKEDTSLSDEDQKRLEKWASDKGFVRKEEFETEKAKLQLESIQTAQNTAVNEFLAKYPKYDDKTEWDKVLSEFQQYKVPSNVEGFRKLLTKIHKDLNGGVVEDDAVAKAKAQDIQRSRLGLGRGATGYDPSTETVESLQTRYPRLSKEQIEARLADLKSIYPEKKK